MRGIRPLFVLVGVVGAATVAGMCARNAAAEKKRASGFVSGIGRIEANEIAVATHLPGRIDRILVEEGQSVHAGQVVAQMQVQGVVAERAEAYARYEHAVSLAAGADADVLLRETQLQAAAVAARHDDSAFQAIAQQLSSAVAMLRRDAASVPEIEELRADARRVAAAAASADAQVAAARVAVVAARLHAKSAHAAVGVPQAIIRRLDATLADAALTAPSDADVQSRLAQPGDVLLPGGRVLSLVDTTNVQMTFTLPDTTVDAVRVGDEVRIVLDSMPQSVFRATISSVERAAPTPARPQIANERQRPMCRLTAHIDRAPIQHHLKQVKAGIAGVAWLRLDPGLPWPPALHVVEP